MGRGQIMCPPPLPDVECHEVGIQEKVTLRLSDSSILTNVYQVPPTRRKLEFTSQMCAVESKYIQNLRLLQQRTALYFSWQSDPEFHAGEHWGSVFYLGRTVFSHPVL